MSESTGPTLTESRSGNCRTVVMVRFGWLYFGDRGFATMHLGIAGGAEPPQGLAMPVFTGLPPLKKGASLVLLEGLAGFCMDV